MARNALLKPLTPFYQFHMCKPSVGDLRFTPPQAFPGGYSGESPNATTRAPSCVQFGTAFVEPGSQSEDWQSHHSRNAWHVTGIR